MNIIGIDKTLVNRVAPLVADFRVVLRSYKGIHSEPNIEAAKAEILDFLKLGYPIFAAERDGRLAGYIVCKIQDDLLWVEHIYVSVEYRRKGVASLLFEKAEEISRSMGEETVFNTVHPNNDGMIDFLRSKGYTVLNLIEIRKPYAGEKLSTTIRVNDRSFDY
ncbi:MAG: GNAT family N-acetyltransferase [Christensenellales bacterium]|jgi:ribosomal protein S18 acetylase RimI-like enzyme